jgi:hypothetical protein
VVESTGIIYTHANADQKMGSIGAHAFVHALWSCTKRYHSCRFAPDAAVCRHGVERCRIPRIGILVRVWTGMRPQRIPWCCPFCHRSGKISQRETRFCIGTRSQLYFDSGGSV